MAPGGLRRLNRLETVRSGGWEATHPSKEVKEMSFFLKDCKRIYKVHYICNQCNSLLSNSILFFNLGAALDAEQLHGLGGSRLALAAEKSPSEGSGARAARSLRSDASDPKGMKPRKEKITSHAQPDVLDETNLIAETYDVRHRLDASRSAMMLRLLRQVPQEALSQELKDVGVAVEDLDKEGLVQAMVQQLS